MYAIMTGLMFVTNSCDWPGAYVTIHHNPISFFHVHNQYHDDVYKLTGFVIMNMCPHWDCFTCIMNLGKKHTKNTYK